MIDAVTESSSAQVVLTCLLAFCSWRIWRFTIEPLLYPNEPKQLPYWIPFIGHAAAFFQNFNAGITKGRRYFAPSQEPFAMTVAGQTIYIATSSQDINAVWKNSKTISMAPLTDEMYTMAGIGKQSREALFKVFPDAKYNKTNAKPLTPTQMVLELHHQQLHNTATFDSLMTDKIVPNIIKQLDFSTRDHPAVQATSAIDRSITISLFDLCVEAFIGEDTDAYFGPKLRQIEPNITSAFDDWELTNWKLLFKLPGPFAKDMIAVKDKLAGAFTKYYKLPRSERPGANFFVTALEDLLREIGLSEVEMGNFTLLHYWAVVGNAYKLAFWLIAYLAHDLYLMVGIRDEVLPAVNGDSIDETYLLEKCPKLASLFDEVLRLSVTSALARVIIEPTVLGGKTLQPGNKIMLPISELHLDPAIWGNNPTTLQPERFIDTPKLSKNISYRPWGGGHTLCPGRFLTRRSVNALVAMLLYRYDVMRESETFPQADGARPSPGVILVGHGQDVRLRCRPRNKMSSR